MPTVNFSPARPEDWPDVLALLATCDLPLAGVDEALDGFIVARDAAGGLAGCAALERYGRSGLLRSVAVAEAWRGQGVAAALTARLLAAARATGITDVTLLTTTAADYFTRYGFAAIPREEAPEPVRASVEFREACPDTATIMTRALSVM